jgi:hypothetical protein
MQLPHVPHVSGPLAILALVAAGATATLHGSGCATTGTTPTVATVTAGALTVEQTTCAVDALIASALPTTSPVQQFVQEILSVCKSQIPQTLTSTVSDLVTQLLSAPPAAYHVGTGNVYRTRLDAMRAGRTSK